MTTRRDEMIEVIQSTTGYTIPESVCSNIADALLERLPFLEWECVANWGDTNTSIEFRKEHEWCPDEVSDITGSDRPDFCGNCGRAREEVK